jgi:hypothetical protein
VADCGASLQMRVQNPTREPDCATQNFAMYNEQIDLQMHRFGEQVG